MSLFAFLLILTSTVLHATWNLIAKKNHMTVVFYACLCVTCAIVWSHVVFWTPIPIFKMPTRFWVFLFASIAADACYCFGLMWTYRHFDMSTSYPIQRSLPILLIIIITKLFGWGEPLTPTAIIGMFTVFVGCLCMPLNKFSDFRIQNYLRKEMLFILLVACGTTGYTVFDSQAQKVIAEFVPQVKPYIRSMTIYSVRCIVLTTVLWTIIAFTPSFRANAREIIAQRQWSTAVASVIVSVTYILVLYSMNFVTNVSYVQVFRQLGLPIGMALGIIVLKEKSAMPKYVGVALIWIGLALTVIKF